MRIRIIRNDEIVLKKEDFDFIMEQKKNFANRVATQEQLIDLAEDKLKQANETMDRLNKKYEQLSVKYKSALTAKTLQDELNQELVLENQRLKKSNAGYKGTIVKFQKRVK